MCQVEMLRALVNRRLTAAVEEIFVVLERTIAEYEGELSRTKEENERQRQLLDAVSKAHRGVLQRAAVSEDGLPHEQQEWTSRMEQEEPQPPHIKEENEEPEPPHIKMREGVHSISEEGEHLEGPKEFQVFGVLVKCEDVEDKSEEKGELEPPSSSSTPHMTTEADGDHCGGSQVLLAPLSEIDDTTSLSLDSDDEDAKTDMTCHTDNTLFKCSQCDKSFGHKKNLKRHVRYHTGEKPFFCSFCMKGFYEKAHLIRHTRIHTGEKPYSCSLCNKCFCDSSGLDQHKRIHSGEKPFTCSVCGIGFVRNQDLKRHMRTHTGEKPFNCSVCGIRLTQKSHLTSHMRTHTGEKPYTCSMCGVKLAQKSHLTSHMRTHTGEKPYTCPFCGVAFAYKLSLTKHRRIHTGEQEFSCSV